MNKLIVKLIGLLIVCGLNACHDAPRKNPFDPALTPSVDLSVAVDDTSGTAMLIWTAYAGNMPFAAYWILRKAQGLEQVDTLAVIADIEQMTFIDTTLAPGTFYIYRVATVNAAGFAVESPTQELRPFDLPPVQIEALILDSATASAALTWTSYRGPRFKAYQIQRRSEESAALIIAEITDLADTAFTDTDLQGNTEYFYQVVVGTQRGEEIASAEHSEDFHQLVDTWTLPMGQRPLTRLYVENGRIVVLVAQGGDNFRALTYEATGSLIDEERPLSFRPSTSLSMAFIPTTEGGRLFALGSVGDRGSSDNNGQFVLVARERGGEMVRQEHALATNALPNLSAAAQRTVLGEIALGNGEFSQMEITADETVLWNSDFTGVPTGDNIRWNGWFFTKVFGELGRLRTAEISGADRGRRADPAWRDFRLEAEVLGINNDPGISAPTIQIGGDTLSRFLLTCNFSDRQLDLSWFFSPPDESELSAQEAHHSEPFPFPIAFGLSYWLRLGAVDGQVSASVLSSIVTSADRGEGFPWTSMALIGDTPALTLYDQPHILTPDNELIPLATPFTSGVGELRVWEGRRRQVGVCLPEENKLLVGTVPDGLENEWSAFLSRVVGPETGQPADRLDNPVSFDVGPDGRIYVLDAGNARIVVYDSARRYVTEWGRFGSGAGEFDFGRGATITSGEPDFAGSIAVDDDGFVYVADELNRRIQKFAP